MEIEKLSSGKLLRLACRVFQGIDNLMTRTGEQSTNPYGFGGALSFGWDMPTASMLYPRRARRWYRIKAELARRGIARAPYNRYRITRGKNKGKIICTPGVSTAFAA